MTEKPIYIMSLEASDIYYHQHRQMEFKREYLGMIPYSLESIKLLDVGLKTNYNEKRDKYTSNDIINVQFKSKVKSADDMLEAHNKKIERIKEMENKPKEYIEYENKLFEYKEVLEYHSSKSEEGDLWDEISIPELREDLYENGLKVRFKNYRTGNVKEIEYVVYKRSSAKSRTGQCLFIKKSLYKKMMNWSRMDLPFRSGMKVDLGSLLAYESLVGSSLESTITINPDNILIVDDVDSKFKTKANVVKKNEDTGFLDSFYTEEGNVSNSLFDGQSLLESFYFPKGKSMMLLRNHMFKSASFNTNIQEFLKDNCPVDVKYDDWEISDMYGNLINAKDVHMITTPSSLKSLKFTHVLPIKEDKYMYEHWKQKVKEDGNVFGVCKNEKSSKLGNNINDEVLQQTSYQMINCLPLKKNDLKELVSSEVEYINRLKSDDYFLVNEIYKNRDMTNSNEALAALFYHNEDLIQTKVFREFKKFYINRKVSHAKKGKIRMQGDYCVMVGNPIEMLYHAISKFDLAKGSMSIHKNEIYTTLFKDKEKTVGFRNPNTSPSNVLISINTKNDKIDKYMNLTDNIVVVNAINFALQDILSGCDYDSDTLLLSNDAKLVEVGERCFGHYHVCLNEIKGDKKSYKLDKKSHFEIDNQLSESQYNIGRVVNLGQLCMSTYWDMINNGLTGLEVDDLLKKVDVMTVLSGIAIDMAKKFYDLDIAKEISYVAKNESLKVKEAKPNFWIYVNKNKKNKPNTVHYDCPMDYLMEELSNFKHSERYKYVKFDEFIKSADIKGVSYRQTNILRDLINEYADEVKSININAKSKEEKHMLIGEASIECIDKVKSWKIKPETIAFILTRTYNDDEAILLKAIKVLYDMNKELLFDVIISGNEA